MPGGEPWPMEQARGECDPALDRGRQRRAPLLDRGSDVRGGESACHAMRKASARRWRTQRDGGEAVRGAPRVHRLRSASLHGVDRRLRVPLHGVQPASRPRELGAEDVGAYRDHDEDGPGGTSRAIPTSTTRPPTPSSRTRHGYRSAASRTCLTPRLPRSRRRRARELRPCAGTQPAPRRAPRAPPQ